MNIDYDKIHSLFASAYTNLMMAEEASRYPDGRPKEETDFGIDPLAYSIWLRSAKQILDCVLAAAPDDLKETYLKCAKKLKQKGN